MSQPSVEQREQVVQQAIGELSHIATLPEITLKIVELVEDPKSTAQDLNRVVSSDPALCSRILKVVNSSFYGLPGQIASINRAIVMLGLNAVKNIAIAASLAKLFRGGELTHNFSARDLWTHSANTAIAAKMIADTLKLGLSDEAFLAGLIHDIGLMVEMQYDRNKLIEVFHRTAADSSCVPATSMLDNELELFGATHQDFGAALCDKWRFPKSFTHVTGYHHRPLELPPDQRTLTSVIYVADRIASECSAGFRQDLTSLEVGPDVRDALRLSMEKLDELKKAFTKEAKNAGNLLG